jgi:hypothetical protein
VAFPNTSKTPIITRLPARTKVVETVANTGGLSFHLTSSSGSGSDDNSNVHTDDDVVVLLSLLLTLVMVTVVFQLKMLQLICTTLSMR